MKIVGSKFKEASYKSYEVRDAIEDHFGKYAYSHGNKYFISVDFAGIKDDGTVELSVHWASTSVGGVFPGDIDEFISELTKVKNLCKTFKMKASK